MYRYNGTSKKTWEYFFQKGHNVFVLINDKKIFLNN